MIESLKKAFVHGIVVREACYSEAFRDGQWIHRSGVIFAAPDCQGDIEALWPKASTVRQIGIISDVPELTH